MKRRTFIKSSSLAAVATALPAAAMDVFIPVNTGTAITTRSADNFRSGFYKTAQLPVATVARGMRKYFSLRSEGDAHGGEAQPLIAPNVKMQDGTYRDLCLWACLNNDLRVYDINTSAELWMMNLGIPIKSTPQIDSHSTNDYIGILSTGVYDPDTQIWYNVYWTSPDGTWQKGQHFFSARYVADGTRVFADIPLAGVTYQPPNNQPIQKYSSATRKQRCSLALGTFNGKKTVIWGSGTIFETTNGAAGWLIACDVATSTLTGWCAAVGKGAGIWMGGGGPIIDELNYVYVGTGNGYFDPAQGDYAESIVKLSYMPPSDKAKGSWQVIDQWSPYTDEQRMGKTVTVQQALAETANKPAGISEVTEQIKAGNPVSSGHMQDENMTRNPMTGVRTAITDNDDKTTPVGTAQNYNMKQSLTNPKVYKLVAANNISPAFADEDLFSSQLLLIPKFNLVGGAGKDGILYLADRNKLGGTQRVDFTTPAGITANYAKLRQIPNWFTYYDPDVPTTPTDSTVLDVIPGGKTRHLHSPIVWFDSKKNGLTAFVCGENSPIRAWTVDNAGVHYIGSSNEVASASCGTATERCQAQPGGMPGGFMCLSGDPNVPNSIVLWVCLPYGDANQYETNARYIGYDAENWIKNQDGSNTLRILWDTQQDAINAGVASNIKFPKFTPPIVYGKYFIQVNFDGSGLDVYGPR